MAKRFTLSLAQRLRSKKRIEELFETGKSTMRKPVRLVWTVVPQGNEATETPLGVQMLVSVSKRNFKRANKRNLLKRRIREAWRLGSVELCEMIRAKGLTVNVALIYAHNECVEFVAIQTAVSEIVENLRRQIEKMPLTVEKVVEKEIM